MSAPALDDVHRSTRNPVLAGLLVASVFVLVFWDFILSTLRWAISHQADWGHTVVIPFIAGYFIYLNRHKLCARPFRTTWVGLLPIVVGVAWYIACTIGPDALRHKNLASVGIASTLLGLALLFCGFRAMAYLWFPIAYLWVFGQTISERLLNIVTFKMQDIAAHGAWLGLQLLGLTVERDGNALKIIDGGVEKALNVAEACSGMRMLMAFLALGVAMAYTGLRHRWQQIALVILAVPTAIFVNILRVISLGLLALWDSNFAAGDFHSFVGLVWLLPAFFIYLGIMWALNRMVIEPPEAKVPEPEGAAVPVFGRGAGWAVGIACVTLAVCGLGFRSSVGVLDLYLSKKPVPLRGHFANIPRVLGGDRPGDITWRAFGDDGQLAKEMIEELGTDQYLNRNYDDGDPSNGFLRLHVAYYTGIIDAVPHVPDRCLVANANMTIAERPHNVPLDVDETGWTSDLDERVNLKSGEPYRQQLVVDERRPSRIEYVRMPIGDFELRTTVFQHEANPDIRTIAGYFFIANGQLTARPDAVRLLAFDLRDRYAYYCKVQFSLYGGYDMTVEEFTAQVSDLLEALLPYLMRHLPDWSEVERWDDAGDPAGPPAAVEARAGDAAGRARPLPVVHNGRLAARSGGGDDPEAR